MEYTFSIIIPHKNVPELLCKCIESIPLRDDLQVIVVDDNSNNINHTTFPGVNRRHTEIYFDKTGKGAGHARNIGLLHAKGDWILFADSDDVFEPYFEKILDIIKKDNESDLVNFEVTSRNLWNNEPNDEIEKINYHCNKLEYIENPSSFKYIVLTPWGKAIRHSLIVKHNILFEEVKYGNDLLFATLCDFYCSHRRIIPIVGYCWKYREDSLWRQENLEWAIIRYNVLMKCGLVMRGLGEKEIAERYINGASSFLSVMKKYSKILYLKYLLKYGIVKRDVKILLWTLPKAIVHK